MSSGAGSTPKVTTKSGGNPRTMAIGMAVVAAALGGFYYTQFYVHKRDDQTYIQRQNLQQEDMNANKRILPVSLDSKSKKQKQSEYIPTPPK